MKIISDIEMDNHYYNQYYGTPYGYDEDDYDIYDDLSELEDLYEEL